MSRIACESCGERRRTVTKHGHTFACARCHGIGNTDLLNRAHLTDMAKAGLLESKDENVLQVWRLLNAAQEVLEQAVQKRLEAARDLVAQRQLDRERLREEDEERT